MDIEQELRKLSALLQEDQALVQQFFLHLGETIPPWLVPGFLGLVVDRACVHAFRNVMAMAVTTDPNGNTCRFWG